jgi:RNA polymerase sigma-70 factor (ECF subfamily)
MIGTGKRAKWLARARGGDRIALVELLASYHPELVRRAGARMGELLRARFEPEDILQEVYLDVFRQVGGFHGDDERSFGAWLSTILESKVIDARRTIGRRKRDASREIPDRTTSAGDDSAWSLVDAASAHSETPSRLARLDEEVGTLTACIDRLPEAQRRVIRLRYMEGRSVQDVARRLGRSEAAVASLTGRALRGLRELLGA